MSHRLIFDLAVGVSGTVPDVSVGVKAPEMPSVSSPSVKLTSGGEDDVMSAPDAKVSAPDLKALVEASLPSVEGPTVCVENMAAGVSGKVSLRSQESGGCMIRGVDDAIFEAIAFPDNRQGSSCIRKESGSIDLCLFV